IGDSGFGKAGSRAPHPPSAPSPAGGRRNSQGPGFGNGDLGFAISAWDKFAAAPISLPTTRHPGAGWDPVPFDNKIKSPSSAFGTFSREREKEQPRAGIGDWGFG